MRQLILLALVGITAWSSTSAVAGDTDVPLFVGHELPSAPAQTKPWTISAPDVPPKLLSATALLFELGLGDPRGCEYREIRLIAVDLWGRDMTGQSQAAGSFGAKWIGVEDAPEVQRQVLQQVREVNEAAKRV